MKTPLADRIDVILELRGGKATAYELACALFPSQKSWGVSSNGGPAGCFMALGAALRRGGFPVDISGPGPSGRIVRARRKK